MVLALAERMTPDEEEGTKGVGEQAIGDRADGFIAKEPGILLNSRRYLA
jgi:hypothetical protein